jgi:flavodoxin
MSRSHIVVFSYHHNNTEKIAKAMAEVLDCPVNSPVKLNPETIQDCDLIGFGSGIYSESFHKAILDFVDKLPAAKGKRAFMFSTDGSPRKLMKEGTSMAQTQIQKNHHKMREKLERKEFEIVGEFNCAGFNTNSFIKFFGGINKGRPNEIDLKNAQIFAQNLKNLYLDE